MMVPFALWALIARCAPAVGPITMSAIVEYESAGRPNAIGDNTTRRSFDPSDRPDAIALARTLLHRGDNIDVGYAQVNSRNFRGYGLDVGTAFDPCTNIATGAAILRSDYAGATRTFGPGQLALAHALSAYNTGAYWSGLDYARGIFATASHFRAADREPAADVRRQNIRALRYGRDAR